MDLRNHIVSEGTLKSEDLIEAFMDVVREVDDGSIIGEFHDEFPLIEAYRREHIKQHHLNDQGAHRLADEMSAAVNELHDRLGDLAPEGFYFGTHPGDGACFGFFRSPITHLDDTRLATWFERDRAHVALMTPDDVTIVQWWDEDVDQAITDGFLPEVGLDPHWHRKAHQAAFDYARQHGLLETVE